MEGSRGTTRGSSTVRSTTRQTRSSPWGTNGELDLVQYVANFDPDSTSTRKRKMSKPVVADESAALTSSRMTNKDSQGEVEREKGLV